MLRDVWVKNPRINDVGGLGFGSKLCSYLTDVYLIGGSSGSAFGSSAPAFGGSSGSSSTAFNFGSAPGLNTTSTAAASNPSGGLRDFLNPSVCLQE